MLMHSGSMWKCVRLWIAPSVVAGLTVQCKSDEQINDYADNMWTTRNISGEWEEDILASVAAAALLLFCLALFSFCSSLHLFTILYSILSIHFLCLTPDDKKNSFCVLLFAMAENVLWFYLFKQNSVLRQSQYQKPAAQSENEGSMKLPDWVY